MQVQTAHGTRGVVAAGHPLATQAALKILRDGGNAVDAAVAAGLVLSVVCPYACTLAGDVYMMIFDPKRGAIAGLNGTGRAPAAATVDQFPDGMARTGIRSASVPGLMAGLQDALSRYGTRDLRTLLEPAIRYAAEGFPVFGYFAANTRQRQDLLAKDPAARALFLPNGAPLAEGATFVQPELAQTLRAIAARGIAAFYEGEIAERMAIAAAKLGGLVSVEDFAAHSSLWQDPVSAPFHGHDVATMPPNSYGPTLLLQLLDLQSHGVERLDPDGDDFIHHGYAARRRAYKAAGKWIGEPSLAEEPMRRLLAAAVANGGRLDDLPAMPAEARDRCTTNVVVIDKDGLAVSLIESISAPYGAGVVLEGTGILLNNRMAGFNTDPTSINCVAPGKRPAHTLAPCMVTKNGELVMSVGTPGTVGQTCTLAQFLARVLACGQDPAAAAGAPRWSVDFKGKLVLEDGMSETLRTAVLTKDPEAKVMRTGWISFGSIKLAMVAADGFIGVADYRRSASTAGF